MIADVFHFSFTVSDIEESARWFTDVLGLEIVHRQRQDNLYTRRLVGMDNGILEVVTFRIPGRSPGLSTHMLELIEYVQPPGESYPLRTNNVGVAHIAFIVDDIEFEYLRLAQGGVHFNSEPVEITDGANKGGFAVYFSAPDGITLELVEPGPDVKKAMGLGSTL